MTGGWWSFLQKGTCLQVWKLERKRHPQTLFLFYTLLHKLCSARGVFCSLSSSTSPTSGLLESAPNSITWWVRIWNGCCVILQKWAKDGVCMLAPRLISWKQSDTCWCKSPSVPNSHFSISNKHEPPLQSRFLAIYSLSILHTLINCSQHLLTNQTGWALGL